MRQLSLENQKLEIELRRQRYGWLRDPDTLFKLVTGLFVLLGAVGTAYYTGLTGTVNRLRIDQEQLRASIDRLDADKKKLESDKQKLEQDNASLSKAKDLINQNLERVELESDLQLLQQNARWKPFSSNPQQTPEIRPILTVIAYVQNHPQRREQNISYLDTKEATTNDLSGRAALDLALFGITGETRFRQRLALMFVQSQEVDIQALTNLMDRELGLNFLIGLGVRGWRRKDKTDFSFDVLSNITGKSRQFQFGVFRNLRFVWNGDLKIATADRMTAPVVLAALALNRDAALNATDRGIRKGALSELLEWSPEAFLATIAKILSDPNFKGFDREEIGDYAPIAVASDVPGLTPRPDGIEPAEWKAWMEEDDNSDFVKLYLDPKLIKLSIKLDRPVTAHIE